MNTKMYSFDVYKTVKDKSKKVATHSYPTKQEAINARKAIMNMKNGLHCFQPGENRPYVCKILGGWTCSEIKESN